MNLTALCISEKVHGFVPWVQLAACWYFLSSLGDSRSEMVLNVTKYGEDSIGEANEMYPKKMSTLELIEPNYTCT